MTDVRGEPADGVTGNPSAHDEPPPRGGAAVVLAPDEPAGRLDPYLTLSMALQAVWNRAWPDAKERLQQARDQGAPANLLSAMSQCLVSAETWTKARASRDGDQSLARLEEAHRASHGGAAIMREAQLPPQDRGDSNAQALILDLRSWLESQELSQGRHLAALRGDGGAVQDYDNRLDLLLDRGAREYAAASARRPHGDVILYRIRRASRVRAFLKRFWQAHTDLKALDPDHALVDLGEREVAELHGAEAAPQAPPDGPLGCVLNDAYEKEAQGLEEMAKGLRDYARGLHAFLRNDLRPSTRAALASAEDHFRRAIQKFPGAHDMTPIPGVCLPDDVPEIARFYEGIAKDLKARSTQKATILLELAVPLLLSIMGAIPPHSSRAAPKETNRSSEVRLVASAITGLTGLGGAILATQRGVQIVGLAIIAVSLVTIAVTFLVVRPQTGAGGQ
jgi:hypothetical protein